MSHVHAPWTEDQVASLNGWQKCPFVHPFTGVRQPNGDDTVLIATPAGWVEKEGGPIVQTWAHSFMADWSWKERVEMFEKAHAEIADADTEPGG